MVAVYSYGAAQVFRASGLFGRVIRDATVYFLVIVWAHLTVTIYTSLIGDVSPGHNSPPFLVSRIFSETDLVTLFIFPGGISLVSSDCSPLCELLKPIA